MYQYITDKFLPLIIIKMNLFINHENLLLCFISSVISFTFPSIECILLKCLTALEVLPSPIRKMWPQKLHLLEYTPFPPSNWISVMLDHAGAVLFRLEWTSWRTLSLVGVDLSSITLLLLYPPYHGRPIH